MKTDSGRKHGLMALLLGLAVAAVVFSFGITDGHICFDDWGYVSGCPFVRDGISWRNITRAFADFGYGAIWMPATFTSYMLDVSVFGDSWKAYHAVNVILHLVNAFLVWRLLLYMLSRTDLGETPTATLMCAIAATVWAVHPLRAEGVTYVASRKEELWTMFAILGSLAFGTFLSKRTACSYGLVLVCFLLAIMSKPTAMCLPFVLLSIAYLEKRLDKRTVISLMPLFALSVCAGLLTLHSQSHPTDAIAVDIYDAAFSWRILNAIVSVGLYAWYTICPLDIHLDYRAVFNGWPVDGWLGIAMASLVGVALLLAYIRLSPAGRRTLLGSAMIFIFSIGPTLGVFGYVNGDQAMADRYTYFPHIAASLLLSYGLTAMTASGKRLKTVVGCSALLVLTEAVCAIPVVRSYENEYTAYSRTLAKDPDNWRALRIVGNEYCARMNRTDEGIAMLRKSLLLRKSQQTADSLAYVLAMRGAAGDFKEVRKLGAAAIGCPARDEGGMMLDALGITYMREADYARAAYFFEKSLRAAKRNHSPDWSLLNLGLCLAHTGRCDDAAKILVRLQNSRFDQVSKRAKSALREIISFRRQPRKEMSHP